MEGKNNSCTPSNNKKEPCCTASKCCGQAPIIVGFVVALVFGWFIFPGLLFSQKEQPVEFTHKTHVEGQGLECSSCHAFREDGSFAGKPTQANCESCHSSLMGESEAERNYFQNFVEKGKEVPWIFHQTQPDNVFFSHAAHKLENCVRCHRQMDEKELCSTCHPIGKDLPYKQNKLTGYSAQTMKMWQCEECHARPAHLRDSKIKNSARANNACFTCHK
ncbi:menaquinone reductase multiheme cytochrome c subunit QrcA [Desulfovibrio litoralis]|uniref:Class III cytochrome C domain-containing protein n=1 Tax=Desulfovibrio litoralis DSM 11393 TaxID=1121455 RepID=A0A1M7SSY5_9BACT|nr:menaquinone reductase multiheme cytochrome c subunit QrcA [Desulfovibrio litoralis]SHN61635.1 hypothetical protein SAMN02745728_01244 [Desulfovibrio litoralis DSM 11393]